MDSSPPTPALPAVRQRRWLALGALALAFVAYAVLLGYHMGAYAGGSDSSGYLNNARLLRKGLVHVPRRTIDGLSPETLSAYAYVPLGFSPVGQRDMVPTYPIGLSLLMVALSPITGASAAPHVVMWLHALLGIILMFALARLAGLSLTATTLGALLLGACPLYLYISLQAMSDTPALVWTTAAVYFAWRSQRAAPWALAAGVSVAVAVLVRPTNLLILAPVAVCLGFAWRRWLGLALGGAPGAVLLGVFNHALYGKILTTGYGDVGSAFSLKFAPLSLGNYIQWLPVLLTPGLLLALAAPWAMPRGQRRFLAVLASWILAYVGFYTFYYHTHETWWYLRFVLPAFPAIILAMLFTGRAIAARWPARAAGATAVLIAVGVLGWDGWWARHFHALDSGRGEAVYPQAITWARAHLPPNAVIAAMQTSGALLYYSNFTFIRWDTLSENKFATVAAACTASGRPFYAMLLPFEIEDQGALARMPGRWTQVGTVDNRYGHVTMFKWEPPSPAEAR